MSYIGARVDESTREYIEQEAERRDRSMSYIISEMLRQAIDLREDYVTIEASQRLKQNAQ